MSGAGEGAFSLIGLISSTRGRVGDLGDLIEPEASTFLHFVEEVEVSIGDGLGGRRLPEAVSAGVCGPENLCC